MSRAVIAGGLWIMLAALSAGGAEWHVVPGGRNDNPGTKDRPFATLARAQRAVRESGRLGREPVTVWLAGGTYYLDAPLVFAPADSGAAEAPVVYRAAEGQRPILSGGRELKLTWQPHKAGIFRAEVPGASGGKLAFTQLFINGRRQVLARVPNFDPDRRPFGGVSADCLSPDRVKRWADPVGGFIHSLHQNHWGSLHYEIVGVEAGGKLKLRGGDQVNRDSRLHDRDRFVENILEELDAPGEWFLDRKAGVLYLHPPAGLDLAAARMEIPLLMQLVELRGSAQLPVRHVRLEGLTFTHTRRVCLEPYEKLLRGDWSIHRSGAVFLEGAEDCAVAGCAFDQAGGNAVFLSGYNRRVRVADCLIAEAGESGVCLVGDPDAVRCPSTWQNQLRDIPDTRSGPKTPNYPAECVVDNNHIRQIGRVGKQTAGVFLSMSEGITVSHNTIHNVPRAGICVNDGTWGGHIIEHNDLYATVEETGDHGPFNSWGRDRYWSAGDDAFKKAHALLDACKVTHIRGNRIHGRGNWGIDLDDGSSNYRVYNNLCLGLGIKFREGFVRRMENNILVGGPGHYHVWYRASEDIVARNIIVCDAAYKFIRVDPRQSGQFDWNLFFDYSRQPTIQGVGKPMTLEQWQKDFGQDKHSVVADPLFVDPAAGDYRVKEDSPALKLGFRNFPMDQFGSTLAGRAEGKIVLHANAQPPSAAEVQAARRDVRDERPFMGAVITDIYSDGIQSAAGLGDRNGVYLERVPAGSAAAKVGLRTGDVILALNGQAVKNMAGLLAALGETPAGRELEVTLYRDQKRQVLRLASAPIPAPDACRDPTK